MCWPLDGSPGCRVVPTGDTYKIDLSGRHQQANHKNVLTVLDDVNVENDDTMTGWLQKCY